MKYFTLILFLFSCCCLNAQDCSDGWAFYRTITVNNSGAESLTDYQVVFELNTADLVANGKLRADGADLRVFADDCTPLPFWGDSLGLNTSTRIWVKLPSLAAGASASLQVYYGKPDAASAADGDNTFLFFDDFTSGIVDPNKWETVGEFATFAVVDGMLNYSSTGSVGASRFKFARTIPTFSEEIIMDYVGAVSNSNGFGFSSNNNEIERLIFRQGAFGFDTLAQVAVMLDTISNGFQSVGDYPFLRFERFAFNTASITAEINADSYLQVNRFANVGLGTENLTPLVVTQIEGMTGFHFIMSSFSGAQTILLDNFRVRQHTATPPVSTTGTEVILDPSRLSSLIDPTLVVVFPNPSQGSSQVSIDYEEAVLLQVYNAQGKQLSDMNTRLSPGQQGQIRTDHLSAGLYFLQFARLSDGALLHTRLLSVVK